MTLLEISRKMHFNIFLNYKILENLDRGGKSRTQQRQPDIYGGNRWIDGGARIFQI